MHPAEFEPGQADDALGHFDRRTFLKWMGATWALGGSGIAGCTRPQSLEKIVPYVRAPEHIVPGVPEFYASVLPTMGFASGFGRGVIVEQHEGRPTKIEGNPDHPSSLGGTDIFMQAAILQLYDPDRSPMCRRADQPCTWGNLLADIRHFLSARAGRLPETRIRLLSPPITSPTLASQIQRLGTLFPQFRHHVHSMADQPHAREGQRRALGRTVTPVYHFDKALRILSLDAHFLAEEPGSLRYARQFAQLRRHPPHGLSPNQTHATEAWASPEISAESIARLYMAESSSTFTGALADHRVAVRPSMLPWIALTLVQQITGQGSNSVDLPPAFRAWVNAAAADLLAHRESSLILAGEYLPPEVHALVHSANFLLGAPGHTLSFIEPVEIQPTGDSSLAALIHDLEREQVDLLLILDTNPVYAGPGEFAAALRQFGIRGHVSLHIGPCVDETAQLCAWHIPLSHPLEAWSDLRGHDGTAAITQPLIEPLWQTKSVTEPLAMLAVIAEQLMGQVPSDTTASDYDRVRSFWKTQWQTTGNDAAIETRWRRSLRDGLIDGTAGAPLTIDKTPDMASLIRAFDALPKSVDQTIELSFRPDPTIGDGSWANHPWLQELPKPLSRITWDTVALVAPETARQLGIADLQHASRQDVPGIRIASGTHTVELPVWIQPGHPAGVLTVYLGGGRRSSGAFQENVGVNVYPLLDSQSPWTAAPNVRLEKTSRTFIVAATQTQQDMAGRHPARTRSLSAVAPIPPATAPAEDRTIALSLYPAVAYTGYKWGMVIDLSACIGCQACVIACQAENNIPTVGKDQVFRGREMHWLRIDTYYQSPDPSTAQLPRKSAQFQPMLCQHCQNAPCELVCPVEATSHSDEGINEMTYNRCIGTRYCSNNCPYKVRRFNFLHYNHAAPHNVRAPDTAQITLDMQKNPNVTVRSRGVMEKCTYCIQRINRARITGKRDWANNAAHPAQTLLPEMRPTDPASSVEQLPRLRLQTACQQACPTEAILFGDLNDPGALVTRLKNLDPWTRLNYGVLTELNTQPRTTYLERLTNPNPLLAADGGART